MSLYKQFGTDKNLETSGIILQYGEGVEIRIARAGGSNKRYQKSMTQRSKPYRRAMANDTLGNDVAEKMLAEVYAESVVLGWEGVTDEQGEALEFNFDNCVKVLTDLPDLFADIREQAQKSALFRTDDLDEDVKN